LINREAEALINRLPKLEINPDLLDQSFIGKYEEGVASFDRAIGNPVPINSL
jgi:hypothetical protein